MTWHLGDLACFDVESSGVDVESDRIVTATVAQIVPGQQPNVVSHLIAVDVEIPEQATEVHGMTTEHARAYGKPAVEVLEAVAAHLTELWANNVPVVAMNAAFDVTMLDRELRRNGLTPVENRLGRPVGPIVDIFVIDKTLDRFRPGKRKLTDLCAVYGVRHGGAHDATEDALAAARVAYRMGQRGQQAIAEPLTVADIYQNRRHPLELAREWERFGRMTADELHERQAVWSADQAASLGQYWMRQANQLEHEARQAGDDAERETKLADAAELRDRADGISTDWPTRPFGGTS